MILLIISIGCILVIHCIFKVNEDHSIIVIIHDSLTSNDISQHTPSITRAVVPWYAEYIMLCIIM